MSYSEIIHKNCANSSVKWWPKFAYHYTDVENAVNILSTGFLYSRVYASKRNLMQSDNASVQVINMTESIAKNFARFYFRPLTPTQYYNEGFKHKSIRYENDEQANVPVPIFLLFDMNKLLKNPEIRFSELSQSGHGSPILQGINDFQNLPFKKIYSNGYVEEDIRKYRHAEILFPNAYNIDDSISFILCRNEVEKTTLMTLLKKKNLKAFYKYKEKIKIGKDNMFENNGLFLKDISFAKDTISFSFFDSYNKKLFENKQMEKFNIDNLDPINLNFLFRWIGSNNSILAEQKFQSLIYYQNPDSIIFEEVDSVEGSKIIEITLFIENKIVACVEKVITEIDLM